MAILEITDHGNLNNGNKVLLQDLKRCKQWFSYCQKTVLNIYAKDILVLFDYQLSLFMAGALTPNSVKPD